MHWRNTYVYKTANEEWRNVIRVKNGSVYVGGQSERLFLESDFDYLLLKMDDLYGNTTGIFRYNDPINLSNKLTSLHVYDNNKIVITGNTHSYPNFNWTTIMLNDITLSLDEVFVENKIQLYPNSISNGEMLQLIGTEIKSYRIISISGQTVQSGNAENSIQIKNLASGLYILKLSTDKGEISKKLVIKN